MRLCGLKSLFRQTLLRKNHSEAIALSQLEEPIRAELFSAERLEQHAKALPPPSASRRRRARVVGCCRACSTTGGCCSNRIGPSPRQSGRSARSHLRQNGWSTITTSWTNNCARSGRLATPAITESCRSWPTVHLQGYPRVYGLAWAFVAHTDSRFDPETLRRFVRAYQRVQPLTIGELWAVAITLRVVLVENLRRLAERIVHGRAARQEADAVADRLLGLGGGSIESAATMLGRFEGGPLAPAFAVQLVQRLRDQDPVVMPALRWLEEHLAAQGTTADEIVRVEHQRQAAMNVTVRNVITSMRLMSAFDWAEFFESVSLVDAILWADTEFCRCGLCDT